MIFILAKDYLERAVAKGHTGAMNNLASMYMSGKQGVERNFKKAYELYSSGKYSKANAVPQNVVCNYR